MPVYFIAEEGTERVKIGYSWWPWRRLVQMQKRHPRALTLMRVIPGWKDIERGIHKHFEDLHLGAEWFTYADEMWECGQTIDIGPRYTSKYSPHKYGTPQP